MSLSTESIVIKYAIPYLTIKRGKKTNKVKIEKTYNGYKLHINKIKTKTLTFNELITYVKFKGLEDDLNFRIEELILMEL